MKDLPDDTKQYLRAFPPYFHWLHNTYGSPQILCLFTRTHDDFQDFINLDFDPLHPIAYDEESARNADTRRHYEGNRLQRYQRVCPWEFNFGWSHKEFRFDEVIIESNLINPTIHWNTKNAFLTRYRDLLVPLLKAGRNDHPLKIHCMPLGSYKDLPYEERMTKYHTRIA